MIACMLASMPYALKGIQGIALYLLMLSSPQQVDNNTPFLLRPSVQLTHIMQLDVSQR